MSTEQPPGGEHEVEGLPLRDEGEAEQEAPPPRQRPPARRLTWQRLTVLPSFLVLLLLVTWLWFRQADLDTISRNALSGGQVSKALWQHVQLTVISTFFVLIIAIPLGILLTRGAMKKATPLAMTIANMGQATPAIGLLALLVIWLGTGTKAALIGIIVYAVLPVLANTIAGLKANDPTLLEAARGIGMSPFGVLTRIELPLAVPLILAGVRTALVGMIAYAVLPVLSNTVAGLKANDPTLLEAARGIGMSPSGVLSRVELPLAVPLILAGVRTALVLNVGTATLATFGGGGGLGVLITAGITNQRMPVLVLGSVLTVALALLVDWLASLAEVLLRPRGLEAGA